MAGTSTSGVVVGLLSPVIPLVLGHGSMFCSGLDHCTAGSAPVVMVAKVIDWSGLDGAWMMLLPNPKSGTVVPHPQLPAWCQVLGHYGLVGPHAISFCNFSALLIRHALLSPARQSTCLLFLCILCGVVCVSTLIHPTRSNSSSSVCTRYFSCSVHTPPFNCKMGFLRLDIFFLIL